LKQGIAAKKRERPKRGSCNQSEEVERKQEKGIAGRGMGGRGIKKSQTLLPIPLPLIPLPKCFFSHNGGLRILPEMLDSAYCTASKLAYSALFRGYFFGAELR